MSETIYVVGHRNPDTDSICSAIAYADLKNRISRGGQYVPCRLGAPNPQTAWVLHRAGLTAPRFLGDVHVRVNDLMTHGVRQVRTDEPLLHATDLMQQERIRMVPVSEDERFYGMITLFSLTDHLLNVTAPVANLRATISMTNLVHALRGEVLSGAVDGVAAELEFLVGVSDAFSFGKELAERDPRSTVLFTADRNDIIRTAIEQGIRAIVVTGGARLSPDIEQSASENGVILVQTGFSITQTLNLAKLAIPASLAAETGDLEINQDVLRSDARRKLMASHHRGLAVVDDDQKVVGILTRSDLLRNVRKPVILVDHNEDGQSVPGLYDAEILEVVDHHRIGGFTTDRPITYLCKPYGSTCTIVATLYQEYGQTPDASVALVMLSGILSDTVMFRSPTCTGIDREMADWLAELADVELDAYGLEMFRNSSTVADRSDEALLSTDMKEFSEGKYAFSVSQIEVVGFEEVGERFASLLAGLDAMRERKGYLFSALLVTDIVAGDSILLFAGDIRVARETGFTEQSRGVFLAKGLISRKKQLLPQVLSIVKELNRSGM